LSRARLKALAPSDILLEGHAPIPCVLHSSFTSAGAPAGDTFESVDSGPEEEGSPPVLPPVAADVVEDCGTGDVDCAGAEEVVVVFTPLSLCLL